MKQITVFNQTFYVGLYPDRTGRKRAWVKQLLFGTYQARSHDRSPP